MLTVIVVPIYTQHLANHRIAYVEVRKQFMNNVVDVDLTESEERDRLLSEKYNKGKLHRALSRTSSTNVESELAYLRMVVEAILPHIISPEDLRSDLGRIFLREVIVVKLVCDVEAVK